MGPISKALDELKFRIPGAVLNVTFKDRRNWREAAISIDEAIMNSIIRPRVLIDCNLVGGELADIPLDGVSSQTIDNFSVVYHIPKSLTQNRTIISALSVGYMPYVNAFTTNGVGYGNIAPQTMNAVTGAAQRVSDAVSGVPPVSNANVELIGENTVIVRDMYKISAAQVLRCILANEENLNNLSPRSYIAFAKLCELAVKSYIYNTMLIKIDESFLQGGQELGAMKNYIESLSDSEENYQTYLLEVWQAVALMNNTKAHDRFIKMMVSPGV